MMDIISTINADTKLYCPYFDENEDYMTADDVEFWLGPHNEWYIYCGICGGEHTVKDCVYEE